MTVYTEDGLGREKMRKAGGRKGCTEVSKVADGHLWVDGVDQTRQVDRDDHEQRDGRPPVDAGAVQVDAFVLIQHRHVEVSLAEKPVFDADAPTRRQ